MTTKISSLTFDSFNIANEVNERLPKYRDNLIAHFPLDNSLENCIPDAEIYVENNIIKTKGIIANIIKTNSGVIATDGVMNFTGAIDCFLELNKEVLEIVNDFEIIIRFKSSIDIKTTNTIMHAAWIDDSTEEINTAIKIDNSKYINPNNFYDLKIIKRNEMLSFFIDDLFEEQYRDTKLFRSNKMIIGQEIITATNDFDSTRSFIGAIEYIKFYKYDNICNEIIDINNFGFNGAINCSNINSDILNIYNKNNYTASLVDTETTLMDYKIKRLSITPTTTLGIDQINSIYINNGIKSNSITYKSNVKYCAYIFFKPISHSDLRLYGNASLITGWKKGHITELNDGWFIYYQYRDGTSIIDETDSVYFSYKSNDVNINNDIIMDISPIIILEGIEIPGIFNISPNQSSSITSGKGNVDKFINKIINEFSVGFEWISLSHKLNESNATLCSMGLNSEDYISIHKKSLLGIENIIIEFNFISTNYSTTICSVPISDIISHNIYIGLSYNKSTKKIIAIIYDKTDNIYLVNKEMTNDKYDLTSLSNWLLNNNSGDLIKNISIYNKALSLNEFEQNYIDTFSIKHNGDIYIENICETSPNINKNNSYYASLGSSTKTVCNRLDVTTNTADPSYLYGGALVGDIRADLIMDLTKSQSISAVKTIDLAWDEILNHDAYILPGWTSGYNSNVQSPTDGYHAIVTDKNPFGEMAIQLTDYNSQFGIPHRELSISRSIPPSELWSACSTGTSISIYLKSICEKDNSILKISFYRKNINTGLYEMISKTINLNKLTIEYSCDFTIDSNWDLTSSASLYINGESSSFETIMWVNDISLVKNGPILSSEIVYNKKTNQDIEYDLHNSIGLKWNEPWQITYWKKPYSSSLNGNISLDSIGAGSLSDKGYIYVGHSNVSNQLVSRIFKNNILISEKITDCEDDKYYNNWIFNSIKYDGTNIITEMYGENILLYHSTVMNIPTADHYYIPSRIRDLALGGWKTDDNTLTSCSLYKDLIILKNDYLTEEQTKALYQKKISYKKNKLTVNCEFKEGL